MSQQFSPIQLKGLYYIKKNPSAQYNLDINKSMEHAILAHYRGSAIGTEQAKGIASQTKLHKK